MEGEVVVVRDAAGIAEVRAELAQLREDMHKLIPQSGCNLRHGCTQTAAGFMSFADVHALLAAEKSESEATGRDMGLALVPAPLAKLIPMAETPGNSAAA